MTLVVALIEPLPESLLTALTGALPAGSTVVRADHSSALQQAQYVIVRDGLVDEPLISSAPRLHAVVRLEGGRAIVDETSCRTHGIDLIDIPSPSLFSVAEHTVMFALLLMKQFEVSAARLRSGYVRPGTTPVVTTQEDYSYNWVGLERFETLRDKLVGLVGIGRIGSAAARLFRTFGSEVIYTNRHPLDHEREQSLGVRYCALDELLRLSDVVSLHTPFAPDTGCIMGEEQFKLMRSTGFLINTARGGLVDERALAQALRAGRIRGAALDVFCVEPLPSDSPLLSAPNLLLTPHVAGIPTADSDRIAFTEAAFAVRQRPAAVGAEPISPGETGARIVPRSPDL